MAKLNELIVSGASRFLSKVYCKEIDAESITINGVGLEGNTTYLTNITVPTSSFSNSVATISNEAFTEDSIADVYFAESSIDVAAKANIKIITGNGTLQLKAKTTPTSNLVIETIRIQKVT